MAGSKSSNTGSPSLDHAAAAAATTATSKRDTYGTLAASPVRLPKIIAATNLCFDDGELRRVFSEKVLSDVLQVLAARTPVPMLLMRSILNCLKRFTKLKDPVLRIMRNLVTKREIWTEDRVIWMGFLKVAKTLMKEESCMASILQLPEAAFRDAVTAEPVLLQAAKRYLVPEKPDRWAAVTDAVLTVVGVLEKKPKPSPPPAPPAPGGAAASS